MADDPVSALPDGWGRRMARWSRRHRSATRAAAASLVVIATVATLAALVIGREQAQTRDALEAEQRARLDESKARVLAQEQSQLALDAIREYSTGVTRDFLLRQPGMEDLRKNLLQAPIRFYRRLARNIERDGIADPSARAARASPARPRRDHQRDRDDRGCDRQLRAGPGEPGAGRPRRPRRARVSIPAGPDAVFPRQSLRQGEPAR